MRDKEPGDFDMAVHAGLHQRRVHLVGLVLVVGAVLEQERAHVHVALVGGQGERGLLELVGEGVDGGARLHD